MHARRVHPDKERLAGLDLALDEIDRCRGRLVVDRLHAFLGQWSGVLDGLLADLAEAWIDGRIVTVACLASQHPARPELGLERRIFWVIRVFRVFLGIEVIEVAEELIEAMHGRQVFIAVAEMVLAELAGGIAERLERLGDSDVARLQANGGARNANLGQAGADNRLPSDEA